MERYDDVNTMRTSLIPAPPNAAPGSSSPRRPLTAVVLSLVLLSAPAVARADLMNTRPVSVGPPSVGAEKTLQSYLD
jgi:hypothetical protein